LNHKIFISTTLHQQQRVVDKETAEVAAVVIQYNP